jgi:DNA repair exonuclease SbcCD ATPase subunit
MAGEVNELSMILGELRAHNQTAKESSAKLFDKIESVEGRLSNIESLKGRLTTAEETLCEHEGRLDEVDQVKHKAIGAAWLGGITAGIVGWFIK